MNTQAMERIPHSICLPTVSRNGKKIGQKKKENNVELANNKSNATKATKKSLARGIK